MPVLGFVFGYTLVTFIREYRKHKAQMTALKQAQAFQTPGDFLEFLSK